MNDDRPNHRMTHETSLPTVEASGQRRFAWPLAIGICIVLAVAVAAYLLLKIGVSPQPHDGGRPGRGGAVTGGSAGGPGGAFGAMPTAVETATSQLGDIPITINALGTVTSLSTVTVKTQINGVLTQVAFKEGQQVKTGDFLAQVDERPYKAALDQIQGQLDRDQALLTNAVLDQQRYKKLVAQDSIAAQQLDTQSALVAQYKGAVEVDAGQIEMAKLNVAYCHILAPISGRIGLRQVDPGNYVQTGDVNGIVVITQMSPISVVFSIPEDSLPSVLKHMAGDRSLRVTAMDRSKTDFLAAGSLVSVDNMIDVTTGEIRLRASFDNKRNNLFPNQFVNVRLLVDTLSDTIVVPTSSIQRGAPGIFVYLVKDNMASIQKVELGPADGETTSIASGLKTGDLVVTQGADRLKDGALVEIHTAGESPAAGKRHHRTHAWGGEQTPGVSSGSTTAASLTPKDGGPAPIDSSPSTQHHQGPPATSAQSQ